MTLDNDASLRMVRAHLAGRRYAALRMAEGFSEVVGGLRGHQIEAGQKFLEEELRLHDEALIRLTLGVNISALSSSPIQRPILVPRTDVDVSNIVWEGIPLSRRGNPDFYTTIVARRDIGSRFSLTARQLEVLGSVVAGDETNKIIGQKFTLELGTVKAHFENIYDRLGVLGKTAAAVKCVREGILYWAV
jgi:DNA-binding CsgD family transcriptional regulator